jgi:hypothetical protein
LPGWEFNLQRLTRRKRSVLAEAQTIEKFLPHLSSTNEDTKRGAILALATLNNKLIYTTMMETWN